MKKLFAILSVAVSAWLAINVSAAESLRPDAQGYIRDWLMLAPIVFPEGRGGTDLIYDEQIKTEAALQPKAGDRATVNGKELTWRAIKASTNHVDFNAELKAQTDRAMGYIVTYIECEQEMPGVIMALASNDEGRLYLNGTDIYIFSEPRTLELDADKGRVTLKKGLNVVVFKIFNEQGNWQGAMRFMDSSGKPLTNLTIKIPRSSSALKDTFKNDFLIGTAVNRGMVTGTAFRRSQEQLAKDIALVKEHFNQITAENDMKWALIHPREGTNGYDFAPADAFVNFGLSNKMEIAGHTLVWHSQTPNWVFAGTNPPPASAAPTNQAPRGFGRYNGPRASRDELLQRMREHIHTVVGRYKGKVRHWDVVNEAIADGPGTNVFRTSLWFEIIGPDFIAKAFQYAHEADPEAILRYNDYGLENPAKRKKLLTLVKSLQEQNVPIHAIGSQAHLNVSITFEAMDQSLAEIATLGLPIHITELDVNTATSGQRGFGAEVSANAAATQGGVVSDADKKLADAYAGIFRAFLKHRNSVKMVTFWGANDANSWRSQGKPLLFDAESQPKPAFDAVIAEALKTGRK